ncbi:tigger transposable element-derived protein 6-like [Montipora foliosa]|uniref:tigger transposable element-derived protein 6-like n=1 Tax=Montipora foliosa TaxID=591990 RepID=UPI0035F1A66E
MKKKDDIVSAFEGGLYKDKRKKMKQSTFPDLDKALSEWFCKVRAMNIPVSGPLLQEKAQYFAEHLGHENFKASNGFLDKFKERHGITGQAVCGEEKSVDPGIVETWSERLPDICQGYSKKDRFNADETGFMWKATPTQTLNLRREKCTGANCSSHVSVADLTNVKLIFFPPNCTSKLQPADQGIIQNVKVHYRKTMIRRMLQCLDENKPAEAINLKDAVFMMAKAWDDVSITTISNCWNKAGFPDDVAEPSHDLFESDEEEETDESDGGLWGSITHHCPAYAEISFSECCD